MEFKNGQVFPLQSFPNNSNFSYFAPSGLQNLENISSNNCILVYTENYIWNQDYTLCEHQQTYAVCLRYKGKAILRTR